MSKADNLINEISTWTKNRTANGQLQMMNILEHIFVSKFDTSLKNATSKYNSLTEKTDVQKFHTKLTRQEKTLKRFLSFGHSYNQKKKKIGTDCQRFLKQPKLQVKDYPS